MSRNADDGWVPASGDSLFEFEVTTISSDQDPVFEAHPLKVGGEWCVLVIWPDDRMEQLKGFPTGAAAYRWIQNESSGWLAQRRPSNP